MMRYLIYLVCLTPLFSVKGQELTTTVSDSNLMIGQLIILNYIVKTKIDDSVLFTPKVNGIQARSTISSGSLSNEGIEFEITGEFLDTFIFENDAKEWIGRYEITAWDSGSFILPGPKIVINDSTFHFASVSVTTRLSDPIDGMDIYDIKENYTKIPPRPFALWSFLESNWWWILLLLVCIAVIFYLKKVNREGPEEIVSTTSLKQRTLIAIGALEKAKLWEKGKLKDHFVELSFILRSYLTSRYNVSLLEKTSFETKLILSRKGLNEGTIVAIARILSESDMVKFAKSEPEIMAILKVSTLAKQIVAETSPLEFDNVE